MIRSTVLLVATLLAGVFFAGCAIDTEDTRPSDISLVELEKRMHIAMDPEERYAKAKTTITRQEITQNRWLEDPEISMVEVKYEQPGNFKWVTYEDNLPAISIIINGDKIWLADYKTRKVMAVEDERAELVDRIRTISKIADPGSKLADVFPFIDLKLCTVDGEDFYKLVCRRTKDGEAFNLYVGKNDYLTRRFKGKFKIGLNRLDYDSRMLRYGLYEGVRIPSETEIISNDEKQRSKVIFYQLDTKFDPSEFRPPVF